MIRPITRARRRHVLSAPRFDPLALGLLRAFGPAYTRLALKFRGMSFLGGGHLVDALRDFYEGRARLIIAFRHPFGDEPQMVSWALHAGVPREAARLGTSLRMAPHCVFLHGYEVPLWSGPLVRWLLPRTGALPVHHARVDGAGLRAIRLALRDGLHPMALAPEGQASYRSETLPRLERGALQLGLWCADELESSGRQEKVLVLPVSVHVRRHESELPLLNRLAGKLEARLGLGKDPSAMRDEGGDVRGDERRALGLRLRRMDEALLARTAGYYGISAGAPAAVFDVAQRESLRASIIEAALGRGEAMLGLRPEGDGIARVYRIRQEGWNRIYPVGSPASGPAGRPVSGPAHGPAIAREIADRRAGEAWYAMRHMELVDLLWYLDASYLEEGLADGGAPTLERLAETLDNLVDLSFRVVGGNITNRPRALGKDMVLVARPPLELRGSLGAYRADRRATLTALDAELRAAFLMAVLDWRTERDGAPG